MMTDFNGEDEELREIKDREIMKNMNDVSVIYSSQYSNDRSIFDDIPLK